MAICHHNFGVSETHDPLDGLLHSTVANCKHPPRVPVENEPERVSGHLLKNPKVAGMHVPEHEDFVREN